MNTIASLIAVFVIGCAATTVLAEIEVTMAPVFAAVGTNATVSCDYTGAEEGANAKVKFYVQADGGNRQRAYTFTGTDGMQDTGFTRILSDDGNGNLIIPGVTLADNNIFNTIFCQVEVGTAENEASTTFQAVALPATAPVATSLEPEFDVTGVDTMVGKCETGYGFPKPTVEFYRGSEKIEPRQLDGAFDPFLSPETTTVGEDGTIKVDRQLSTTLTESDDNKPFFCIVKSGAGTVILVQNVTMAPVFRVKHAVSQVSIVPSLRPPYFAGQTLTLACSHNGYPDAAIVSFNGGTDASVTLDLTKADNGKSVTCSAANAANEGSPVNENVRLEVNYMDKVSIDGVKAVKVKQPINVTCAADAYPPAIISLYKGEDKVADEGVLSIAVSSFDDGGLYKCVAANGYDRLDKDEDFTVTVTGLVPDFTDGEVLDMTITDGQKSIELACGGRGSPDVTFTWERVGSEDPVDSVDKIEGVSVSSKVVLSPIDATLSKALYRCTVRTSDGDKAVREFQFQEIVEKASSAPGIIVAILIALLLVAVVFAVLYHKGIICKKGEKKGDEAADDIDVEINKDSSAKPATNDVEAGANGMEADAGAATAEEKQELLENGAAEE